MTRFSGTVGYATSEQAASGVWVETITEYAYYGDVIQNSRRLEQPSQVPPVTNVGVSLDNSFSIVADDHAYANFLSMRYVSWEGSKWQITNVLQRRPRLILTVGGLWHGNTP